MPETGEDQFSGWSEYYDLVYEGENREDRSFYLEKMKKARGKVLEIGCGTGRIYLDALEKGVDIYGIDISEEMLEKLREKAQDRGLEPEVKKADMTSFRYDEKFSLITIPFRTFLHNLTMEDQIDTLRNCRKHLEDGGKLVLNFYLPDFEKVVEGIGETKVHELEKDGETFRREVTVEWEDEIEQIRKVRNEVYNSSGELEWENDFMTKIVSKREFELLLENTGFSDWKVHGGFKKEELESTMQEAVWIIEK